MVKMPKIKKTVTLDKDLLAWVEGQIKEKRFASLSHALEYALKNLKDSEH